MQKMLRSVSFNPRLHLWNTGFFYKLPGRLLTQCVTKLPHKGKCIEISCADSR